LIGRESEATQDSSGSEDGDPAQVPALVRRLQACHIAGPRWIGEMTTVAFDHRSGTPADVQRSDNATTDPRRDKSLESAATAAALALTFIPD
jgi:hypothetical protein